MISRAVRRFAFLCVVAALLISLFQVADQEKPRPRVDASMAAGVLSMSNSKDGQAILTASNLAPGGATSGDVTITNSGDLAGEYTLGKSNVTDTPGPGGGSLSGALQLVVEDLTTSHEVYRGSVDAMASQSLGTFSPGEARTYRFTVELPAGSGNPFAGATASVQYDWQATAPEPGSSTHPPSTPSTPATPASPKTPSTPTRPRLKLRVGAARRQQIVRRRGVILAVRCSRACTVTVRITLTFPGSGRRVRLREVRVNVPAGRTVRVRARVSARTAVMLGRALRLAGERTVRVSVSARATERGGAGRATSKLTVGGKR